MTGACDGGAAAVRMAAQIGPGSTGTGRGAQRRVAIAAAASRCAILDDAAPRITAGVIGAMVGAMVVAAPRA